MFGRLSKTQEKGILPFVKGRVIHDMGAGDLRLADFLLTLGATRVVAIDRVEHRSPITPNDRLRFVHASFIDYLGKNPDEPIDVSFMSWPFNLYDQGLYRLAQKANTIIYLGHNTGGTACGFPKLFEHFVTRKLEVHLPERANTLLVLGAPLPEPREPTREELGGIDQSKIYF